MGSPARYACCGKEMLGWIREKMATPKPQEVAGFLPPAQESAPRSGKFSASGSITTGNNTSACNDPCALGKDYSTAIGNNSWVNAHTSDLSSKASVAGWW